MASLLKGLFAKIALAGLLYQQEQPDTPIARIAARPALLRFSCQAVFAQTA
jgi:hypothetical protein